MQGGMLGRAAEGCSAWDRHTGPAAEQDRAQGQRLKQGIIRIFNVWEGSETSQDKIRLF